MFLFGVLNKLVFGALVFLIVITPIPYGTVEPWWKAAFICAVFAICILALIENLLTSNSTIAGKSVLLPMLALSALAFLQTLSLGSRTEANLQVWNAISADPYQTRFFALQLLALTTFLALLYRYASTERRIRVLVHIVFAIAVVSAVFGILRQSTQLETGSRLRAVHQQEPLRLPDGDGFWPRLGPDPRRRSQTRSIADLRSAAVARLDGARAREFTRRCARDDRSDRHRYASVYQCPEDWRVSSAKSHATRRALRRCRRGNIVGRRRSTRHELRSHDKRVYFRHLAAGRESQRDLARDVEDVCGASDPRRGFRWLLDRHHCLSQCFRSDDAAGSTQRLS